MRAHDFINELRRNPEQNVRVSGWDQFTQIYDQHEQQGGTDNLYISLTELEKLGINPMSEHETPNGVYSYPADYVIQMRSFEALPFAGDQPWVNVFTAKPNANVVRVDTMTAEDLKGYLARLIAAYPERKDEILKLAKSAPKKAFADDGWDEVPNRKQLKKMPGAQLWYITFELCEWDMNLWNKLFRVMGIDAAADYGTGIIHHMEPTQTVFFNSAAISTVSRFPNSTAPTEKSIKHRRKQGIERTQTIRDINSVSEKEQIAWLKRGDNKDRLEYIKNPSPNVQMAAVKLSANNVLKIKNPNQDVLMYAVKKMPQLLDHFKNQTVELQLAAIGKEWDNITYLDNPLPETVQYVLRMISPIELKQLYQDQKEYAEMRFKDPYPWLPKLPNR